MIASHLVVESNTSRRTKNVAAWKKIANFTPILKWKSLSRKQGELIIRKSSPPYVFLVIVPFVVFLSPVADDGFSFCVVVTFHDVFFCTQSSDLCVGEALTMWARWGVCVRKQMIWRFKRCWVQKYCVIRILRSSWIALRTEKKSPNSIKKLVFTFFFFLLHLVSCTPRHGMARDVMRLSLIELHPVSIDWNRKQIFRSFVTKKKLWSRRTVDGDSSFVLL